MKKIRINNDIAIYWSILVDGEKKNLEEHTIEVEISNTRGYSMKPAVTIQGNTLVFGFKGTEQTSLGVYTLKATDTTDGAMHTLDIAHAFELVPHSCEEDCECRYVKGIEIKYVQLTSDIPSALVFKTINGESIVGEGNIETDSVTTRRYTDLLYGVKYSGLDYEFAQNFFKENYTPVTGGCSVVRIGNKIGRNLDWYYNHGVEFIVETDASNGRHATKGFAGTISALTKDVVAKGIKGDMAKILPFRMLDGLNDAGVMASVNIVNANAKRSIADKGTIPNIEERDEVCIAMLVRYILDNFGSAKEACEYIRDYVRVYAPVADGKKNEAQVFVADKSHSYVLAFEGTSVRIIEKEFYGVLTNFRIADTKQVGGKYVIGSSNIEDYGSGIERANIAISMMKTSSIEDVMSALGFTHAYALNGDWYSEFVGDDATIYDTDILRSRQFVARGKYTKYIKQPAEGRNKGDIWHTTHVVIYDLDAMTAEYATQEINDGNTTSGTILNNDIEVATQLNKIQMFTEKFFVSDLVFNPTTGAVTGKPTQVSATHEQMNNGKTILIQRFENNIYNLLATTTINAGGSSAVFSFIYDKKIYKVSLGASNTITTIVYDMISDAPSDDRRYVRQNGAWVSI